MTNSKTPVSFSPALAVFKFHENEVRTVTRDGEPWFVAVDVCRALGYLNTSKAVGDHLDADERATLLVPRTPNDSLGVQTNVINESGLYALVLRSRKPEARKFAKWVTSEVLPTIRKTGKFEAKATSGPLTIEMREKIKGMVVQKLDAEQYTAAIAILAKMQVNWELVDDEPPAVPQYRPLESGKLIVDRVKLAAIWIDLGKLRSRLDGLGIMESDLPPVWWEEHAISQQG